MPVVLLGFNRNLTLVLIDVLSPRLRALLEDHRARRTHQVLGLSCPIVDIQEPAASWQMEWRVRELSVQRTHNQRAHRDEMQRHHGLNHEPLQAS